MAEARVAAQAKINLWLRILAREASGYHQIETLFCRLTLADGVVVRLTASGRAIDCRGADVGPPEKNLAYRAALAYGEIRGWPAGVAIEIDKRIPVGGGLGGGSADAGAVLRALAALDPAPPDHATLLRIAGHLGADVPVMASDAPLALAWGRGDRFLPLTPLPARPVVLYVPPFGINTAAAYGWVARGDAVAPAEEIDPGIVASWERLAPFASNDFESAVGGRHPEIPAALTRLRAIDSAIVARMSGSGSTLFAILANGAPPDVASLGLPGETILTTTATTVAPVEIS